MLKLPLLQSGRLTFLQWGGLRVAFFCFRERQQLDVLCVLAHNKGCMTGYDPKPTKRSSTWATASPQWRTLAGFSPTPARSQGPLLRRSGPLYRYRLESLREDAGCSTRRRLQAHSKPLGCAVRQTAIDPEQTKRKNHRNLTMSGHSVVVRNLGFFEFSFTKARPPCSYQNLSGLNLLWGHTLHNLADVQFRAFPST